MMKDLLETATKVYERGEDSEFYSALEQVYQGIKGLEDQVFIEYAEAINVYPKWMETDEDTENIQAPAWIEIYAPREEIDGINTRLTKLAVYDTPDSPFGEDEPAGVFELSDVAGAIELVKSLVPKVAEAPKPVDEE